MELSSHQEGQIPISIPIPIPINTSYGASSHLGHMIHHHQHQHQHHQDPSSTLTHTLIHNSHLSSAPLVVAPPQESHDHQIHASINNNGSSIPTRSTASPNQEEENEDHEDHDEHANIVNVTYTHINNSTNNNNKVAKVVNNIKYKECLKNHAATIGGNATDGCGEFMPSGEEGSIEALTCSACNCHRNFHRKETQGELKTDPFGRKVLLGLHPNGHKNNNLSIVATSNATTGGFLPSRTAPHHYPHMIMSYNNNMGMMGTHFPSESDEQEQDQTTHHNYHGHSGRAALQVVKKRYRTKFTQEQKEKMFHFAEKVGWKIQKQEESVVQSFCHEIGVKRRVLKVWMHNNKHNLANNNNNNKSPLPQPSTTTHA